MHKELIEEIREILQTSETRTEQYLAVAECIRTRRGYRWVGLYDVTPDKVRAVAFTGNEPPAFPVFSIEQGLTGEAIRTRRTVIANDVSVDPRYLTAFGTTKSEMIVPVLDARTGVVVGTIDAESDRVCAFGDPDRVELEEAAALLEAACHGNLE